MASKWRYRIYWVENGKAYEDFLEGEEMMELTKKLDLKGIKHGIQRMNPPYA